MDFYNDIERFGDREALLLENNESISYSALIRDADRIRGCVRERCLLLNICDNRLEAVAGYLGFLRGRIPQLLLSNNTSSELIKNLIRIYSPGYLWASRKLADDFPDYAAVHAYQDYLLLKAKNPVNYPIHDDLALLLTTSGSTGSPKVVRQSHRNIVTNAASIASYLGISSSDRPITSLPMSYTFGLSVLNSHLLQGASIVLTSRTIVDKTFWQLLEKHQVTTLSGVPYTYEMLKRLGFAKMGLPSLRQLTQAGGKLSIELSREFAEISRAKGVRFFVMYGQTEASPRMSYLPPEFAAAKAGSIGVPIPGGEFWLEDEDGRTITKADEVGELVYRGENVCLGYASSYADLIKGDENGGVLRTGDLAKRDMDGFYYIVGRNKRFLKIFGNRVNLEDVEMTLSRNGFKCVCSGEDNKMRIYTTQREKLSEIRTFIVHHTSIPSSGFEVVFIDGFPRNEYGRIRYSLLS